MNKYLTLEELFEECVKNKLYTYSSSEHDNKPIVVTVPALFETDNSDEIDGLYKVRLKACHTKLNRNNSYITKEVMEEALPSFYNKPILAHIIEVEEGEYDFDRHNMEIIDDPFNEGEKRINYIEKPIGIVPESGNAHLEYDEEEEKDYVVVDGYIFTDYSNGGYEIIKKKGGTKVSVELAVEDMHYNTKENCLYIDKFTFSGVTCLGEHVMEGMKGSNLSTTFEHVDPKEWIEALERVNAALAKFNIEKSKEGGNNSVKLQELLEKYSVNKEDLSFEVEGLTDEELEAKFVEVYEDASSDDVDDVSDQESDTSEDTEVSEPIAEDSEEEEDLEPVADEAENEEEDSEDEEPVVDSIDETKKIVNEENVKFARSFSEEDGIAKVSYEISHEDLRYSLYVLLGSVEEADEEWYFITNVYDDYFVYENWDGNKIYKQAYIKDEENVEFSGDRIEVFKELVTAEEKAALDAIRASYNALMSELNQYRAAAKEEIITSEVYAGVVDTDEYKELKSNLDKFSVEEIQTKMDLLLAKQVKAGQFSFNNKQSNKLAFGEPNKEIKEKPYGTLFDN